MDYLKIYNFRMPRNIVFGVNAAKLLPEKIKGLGGSKILVVTDKNIIENQNIRNVLDNLKRNFKKVIVYDEVTTEPTVEHVDECAEYFRSEDCDLVVALGGGSCIDAGKGVALLGTNHGKIVDYEGKGKVKKAKSPLIAIPTTAGTGSEVTWVAVYDDRSRNEKFLVYSPLLVPEECIEDPLLTMGMPPSVTMSSGMDALTHAIEGYISTRDPNINFGSDPLISYLALPAIELISTNIRKAWADGENIEARSNMLLGQLLAGMTFGNSGTALVHGMARPLGGYFHVPHGLANAIMLPTCLEYTYIACPEKFKKVAIAMGENVDGCGLYEAAEKTISAVKRLCKDLRVPSLQGLGIDKDKFDSVLVQMAKDGVKSGTPLVNPRKPTVDDMVEMYQKSY